MPDTPLRCSALTQANAVSPTGTALPGTSVLLAEHPLPWPRDISEDPLLARLGAAVAEAGDATGARWRVQAVAVEPGSAEQRRITAFVRPEGPFRRYRGSTTTAAPGDAVVDAAAALVADPTGAGDPIPADHAALLVCTHGRRDVCCGHDGTELWLALREPGALPANVGLHRTSHTGGHRFAPTAIHLPSGTMWGWLDPVSTRAIVERAGSFADVAHRYRGTCAFGSREEQVVERAVFERIGWEWLDHARSASSTRAGDGATVVRIDHTAPDGTSGTWTATVVAGDPEPVPVCGEPIEAATKSEPRAVLVEGSLEEATTEGVAPS